MSEDAIDLKYAKQVADYIGSDHTEVIMTKRRVLDSLEEVISILGTYDITTVRDQHGHVPALQMDTREHRHTRAAHRRDIRRAFRLQIHRFRTFRRRVPERIRKAHPRAAHVRRAPRRPLHLRKLAGSARSVRRYRLRKIRDGRRPCKEDEHLRQGRIPCCATHSKATVSLTTYFSAKKLRSQTPSGTPSVVRT